MLDQRENSLANGSGVRSNRIMPAPPNFEYTYKLPKRPIDPQSITPVYDVGRGA